MLERHANDCYEPFHGKSFVVCAWCLDMLSKEAGAMMRLQKACCGWLPVGNAQKQVLYVLCGVMLSFVPNGSKLPGNVLHVVCCWLWVVPWCKAGMEYGL